MILTLQIQILPESDHERRLRATVERFNEAANWAAGIAFAHQCSNKIQLQKLVYRGLRDQFGLSAQMAVRCIAQVCEAYRRDKSIRPVFRPHAAMPFDQRMMSFKGPDRVSLLTLGGRVIVACIMGQYQRERFTHAKGQADLVRRQDGKWFLLVTVDVPEAAPVPVTDFVGVDLGVVNLGVTDDGKTYSGADTERARKKYKQKKKTCQRTGTRSAKRKLNRTRKKESRFRKSENHRIAKEIVEQARGNGRGIGVEDLKGIGGRIPARGPDARHRMKGWAFAQLLAFIRYKAALAGIPVVLVDPAYTSQTCPACGHCERRNRKSRNDFQCRHCGYANHADVVGAINIRRKAERDWAAVGRPTVAVADARGRDPGRDQLQAHAL